MATSGAPGYVPNIHHPEIMRSILTAIVETGDVLGAAGPGRTILAVTIDNWHIDELATLGTDLEDREPEDGLGRHPWACAKRILRQEDLEPYRQKCPRRCLPRPAVRRKRQLAGCCSLDGRVPPARARP